MTTAKAPLLYGPDGHALTPSATQPTARTVSPRAVAGDWQPITIQGNATVWEKTPTTPAAPAAEPAPAAAELTDHQKAGIAAYERRIAELEAKATAMAAASPRQPNPAPKNTPKETAKTAAPKRTAVDRFGPWVALYAAVGLTASGEYALAHLVGFPGLIAALLPTAIDVYVIQAMRRHRDVAAALLLMVATNALYHLAEAHLFGVAKATHHGHTTYPATWWLIVLVAGIAPFIVWRVHRITETRTARSPETASLRPAETASHETRPAVARPDSEPVAHPTVAARETVPETPSSRSTEGGETASETTPPADRATPETQTDQRETSGATRNATPRRRSAAPARETARSVTTPIDRNAQLAIVGRFVDAWDGPDEKLPLQPIADALGRSKPTASRLVREYRNTKTA